MANPGARVKSLAKNDQETEFSINNSNSIFTDSSIVSCNVAHYEAHNIYESYYALHAILTFPLFIRKF